MERFNAQFGFEEEERFRKGLLRPLKWTSRRELTGRLYGRTNLDSSAADYSKSRFYTDLYNSFAHANTWNKSNGAQYHYGAVFNLDFSPDGSVLVAACERKSLLLFDPLTNSMHRAKTNAHGDCVNVVRFIDSRLFATCSDDRTVKLWDLRNTDKELQVLSGHSNWVKNIECIDGKLLTSGFDGNIIMWDYGVYTETGEVPHQAIFQTRNLMRTALSPDHTKLFISTSSGYIMMVHDLDINTLAEDLKGFKPNIYRLMQLNPAIANAKNSIAFNHLFDENRPKNRLELLSDFTDEIDVEIIASIKMHPSSNFMVSRNVSTDEYSEHTCVHDLRDAKLRNLEREPELSTPASDTPNKPLSPQYVLSLEIDNPSNSSTLRSNLSSATMSAMDVRSGRRQARFGDDSDYGHSSSRFLQNPAAASVSNVTLPTGTSSNSSDVLLQQLGSAHQHLEGLAATYASTNDHFVIFVQGDSDGVQQTVVMLSDDSRVPARRPRANKSSRLIYYLEEPNLGRGYIKEQCFSHDGRIICSPFAHGVRLLGFDPECRGLDEMQMPKKPVELQQVASIYSHQNLVVTTKYSPTHNLLVTGCVNGQVCFHQPVL